MYLIPLMTFSAKSIVQTLLSMILLSYLIAFPIASTYFLRKHKEKLSEKHFQESFGSLFNNLKTFSVRALYFTPIFMVRRLILALSIIYMYEIPIMQLLLMSSTCTFSIWFIITVHPFEDAGLNKMEIFNEVCLFVASINAYMFSEIIDEL
jgi:hypothetical protein